MDNNFVLPSSLLEMANDDYFSAFNGSHNNVSLKIGLVKKCYEMDDERNISKKAPEYDVLAFEQNGDKGIVPITYRNCVSIDSFGGIGNFFEHKIVVPTNDPSSKDANDDDGSYVLLLCIDGSNTKGVIITALPHHNRKSNLTKDAGMAMEGEFNGIRIRVNKEGELIITQKGATDKKGKPTTALGSQIKMEKDGSVELNDRALDGELKDNTKENKDTAKAADPYDFMRIDKTKQSIAIDARKDITETAGGNFTQTVKENTTLTMKDLLITASGKASLDATATIDLKAGGEFNIKGSAGKFSFDDALTIMASVVKVNAQTINLGAGGSPALMLGTQMLGIGNLGIPVLSTAIGPFSSVVFVAP